MYLSDEAKARYVKDPTFCPYCNNKDLTSYGLQTVDEDFAIAEVECNTCSKWFTEVFELTDIVEEEN
jgi:transcription elongation factor Elf1